MQKKVFFTAVGGGVLALNILVFLLVDSDPDKEQKALNGAVEAGHGGDDSASPEPLPEPVSRIDHLRHIGEAMYLCEQKIRQSAKQIISFSFDDVASYYTEQDDTYHVFGEYQEIATELGDEPKHRDILCDVSGAERKIVNFKLMPK